VVLRFGVCRCTTLEPMGCNARHHRCFQDGGFDNTGQVLRFTCGQWRTYKLLKAWANKAKLPNFRWNCYKKIINCKFCVVCQA
jgi:hypothetical protein